MDSVELLLQVIHSSSLQHTAASAQGKHFILLPSKCDGSDKGEGGKGVVMPLTFVKCEPPFEVSLFLQCPRVGDSLWQKQMHGKDALGPVSKAAIIISVAVGLGEG